MFLIIIIPLNGEAEEVIRKGELLNVQRCAEIALIKHPGIIAAKNAVNVSENRVGQARANYYPVIDWVSSTSRTSVGPRETLGFRTGSAIFNSYSTGAALSQTIYDFGKTSSQVRIESFKYDSSLSDLEDITEQIILKVKQTYYGVLQARRNRAVAEEAVKQFGLHLRQAKGFFEVGTKPKFDVTKAEVDLSNAKLSLIKAENAVRLAVATLNNAMGVPGAAEYALEDNLSFAGYDITLAEALDRAQKNRPDMQSFAAKRRAAEMSLDLARTGYYPALTGNAGYNYAGNAFPIERGWNIGATLTVPLFSGFLTKHRVGEAKANLDVVRANEESLRQTIFLDVQQAYLSLREAEERIPAAELVVKQAEENFAIAGGRYEAGVGNPIEVTDAQVALSNAKTAHIQALYDFRVARAALDKAMGTR